MNEQRIVIDCPVCRRTIWWNAKCLHGAVPDPLPEEPKEAAPVKATRKEIPPYKRGRR